MVFYDSAIGTYIIHQNFAFVRFMPRTILFESIIFYKFVGKDLGFLNIKSFKSKQYNLQARALAFMNALNKSFINIRANYVFIIVKDSSRSSP